MPQRGPLPSTMFICTTHIEVTKRYMKKLAILLASIALGAQTPGTVTYTPPVTPTVGSPGKVVTTSGAAPNLVTCTATGNAVPATAVLLDCTLGGNTLPEATFTIQPGQNITINYGATGNQVAFLFSVAAGGGPITFQASANGSSPATQGTF